RKHLHLGAVAEPFQQDRRGRGRGGDVGPADIRKGYRAAGFGLGSHRRTCGKHRGQAGTSADASDERRACSLVHAFSPVVLVPAVRSFLSGSKPFSKASTNRGSPQAESEGGCG